MELPMCEMSWVEEHNCESSGYIQSGLFLMCSVHVLLSSHSAHSLRSLNVPASE
jgi:hypothetical protein